MTTPPESTRRIDRLVRRRERDPRTHTFAELADLYREAGQLEHALTVIQDGLLHHPHFLNARLVHARLLRELGRGEEATSAFQKVLEIDSENATAHAALSQLLDGVADMTSRRPEERRSGPDSGATQWLARLDADWRNGGASDGGARPAGADAPDAHRGEEESVVEGPEDTAGKSPDEAWPSAKDAKAEMEWRREASPRQETRRGGGDDLETATLAQLYVNQGLVEKAIGIYERLLARDPYNARLAASLEEARRRAGRGGGRSFEKSDPQPEKQSANVGVVSPPPPYVDDELAVNEEDGSPSPPDEETIGDFLGTLLDGRSPVEQSTGGNVEWPAWLTRLGTNDAG